MRQAANNVMKKAIVVFFKGPPDNKGKVPLPPLGCGTKGGTLPRPFLSLRYLATAGASLPGLLP
jgi:hypothetical protein